MGASGLDRGLERVADVAARGSDLVTLWHEVGEVLGSLVPHHIGACCYTLDPASLLMTSHVNPGMYYPLPETALHDEYLVDDVHDMASVARSSSGVSTLHDAAGGDPTGTARWRSIARMGGDQELLLALRTRRGTTWGCIGLYRAPGQAPFDADERRFLQAAAPLLAEAACRALLIGEARDPDVPDPPGLLVVTEQLEVESATAGATRWLAELPGSDDGRLPVAVVGVAGRALRGGAAAGGGDAGRAGEAAVARVRGRDGTWLLLHGAPLDDGGGARRAAVIVEPAHPARIQPLLMAAYGLTEREQEVARCVLAGDSTAQIAERLVISPHTVQEHLKGIFEKTGVRSRRDLVGRIFFNHYEPRLRDNERRVADGRPLRGGPSVAVAEARAG